MIWLLKNRNGCCLVYEIVCKSYLLSWERYELSLNIGWGVNWLQGEMWWVLWDIMMIIDYNCKCDVMRWCWINQPVSAISIWIALRIIFLRKSGRLGTKHAYFSTVSIYVPQLANYLRFLIADGRQTYWPVRFCRSNVMWWGAPESTN